MRQNDRNIFLVASGEYVRWLMNPRMIMLLVLVILIREQIIVSMIQAAAEMEQPLNGVEPLRLQVCDGCGEGCAVGVRGVRG